MATGKDLRTIARGPAKSFDPEKVLDLAMKEFWTRGYSATSVSDLREVTGLGAKSLYDTYGGKRELFLAAIDRYGDTIIKDLFDDAIDRLPPLDAMKSIFRTLIKYHKAAPHNGCLLGVAAAEVENDAELAAAVNKHLSHVQKVLEETLSKLPRTASSPPPAELASFLMVLFQGANLVARVDGKTRNAATAVRAAEQLLDQCIE